MPIDEVRKLISAIDNNKTEFNTPPFTPFISKRLRDLVGISKPIDNEKKLAEVQQKIEELRQANDESKQQIEDKVEQANKQIKDELKQMKNELMKDMQELLNSIIKNSNVNNDVDKGKTDE